MRRLYPVLLFACLFALPCKDANAAQPTLADKIAPLIECLSGQNTRYELDAHITVEVDGKPQQIDVRLYRDGNHRFDLAASHTDYALRIRRDGDSTAFALPKHQKIFVGHGDVIENDNLMPLGILSRLISSGTDVATYAPIISSGESDGIASLLQTLLAVRYDQERDSWVGKDGLSFRFPKYPDGHGVAISSGTTSVKILIRADVPIPRADWSGLKQVELPRAELERQLARGVRRTLEILAPSRSLKSPSPREKKVAGGELRWVEGQRVALLSGSPEQVGRAHGELLRTEATRCIDSVMYAFGTVETVRTGRWFRHDLEAAYERLSPHIPERHKEETRALAMSLQMDTHLVETLNVFPELFHCSGFAVFGDATTDGKLYHGRVLDYMTTIGLQDAATTFIVAVDGKIPFANVGYAGFIGSVTGMNAKSVSLGEMGGGGEGQWDGVPMATLMRRALEECSTLEEVKDLWESSPRTCEYFYVFADGKTNEAVGVAALPESIEFIDPGQAHERLGEGIKDAVVLSAGDRLAELRKRVQEHHGKIDAETARWLMSRPVAMESNLHNALFIPADGIFYVANASHDRPAADCSYVRHDLNQLLQSIRPQIAVRKK